MTENIRDWLPLIVFVFVVVSLTIILPVTHYPPWLSLFIILTVAFAGLFLLVRWQWNAYTWKCRSCGHIFKRSERSVLAEFFGPHLPFPARKLLKCPRCSATSWCLQMKEEDAKDGGLNDG